jgi:uncharacterized protein (TIGR02596 family)
MNRLFPSSTVCRRGFTLIEMLVVVTIVVLMLALATPALTRTMQSTRLSSAGESIMGSIAEAQQTAYSTNTPVEMRFFSFVEDVDQSAVFHSYQLFKITSPTPQAGGAAAIAEVAVPVGNLNRLPEGIIIPLDASLSGAFAVNGNITGLKDTKDGASVGYSGVSGANYCAIRFLPDNTCRSVGSTTNGLATLTFQTNLQQNFFTITYGSGATVTLANLPKNFYTIQIDPYTGKARTYKPGF